MPRWEWEWEWEWECLRVAENLITKFCGKILYQEYREYLEYQEYHSMSKNHRR